MKLRYLSCLAATALSTSLVWAQPPGEGEGRPEGSPRFGERGQRGEGGERGERGERGRGEGRPSFGPPAILTALDADGDGIISAEELANAVEALKKLDTNNDGQLTMEELGIGRGFGGPGGPRPPFGGAGGPGGPGRPFGGNMFAEFDKDGDGKISREEAPERMREGFDRMDTNGDGFIDQDEIRQMMERFRDMRPGEGRGPGAPGEGRGPGRGPEAGRGPGSPDAAAVTAAVEARMKELDTDGDGKISKEEAPERMRQGFDRLDTNGDGFIDQAEIRQMMDRARENAGNRPPRPEGN